MQWPPTSPGRNGRKFHLLPAASRTSSGVDADPVEDDRQFVHQGDVEIALGVLDDLGCLGHLDAGRRIDAGGDHAGIHLANSLEGFGGIAGDHLDDLGQRPLLVARVDPLGRIADEEILLPFHSRMLLDDRNTDLPRSRRDRPSTRRPRWRPASGSCRPLPTSRSAVRNRVDAPGRPASAPRQSENPPRPGRPDPCRPRGAPLPPDRRCSPRPSGRHAADNAPPCLPTDRSRWSALLAKLDGERQTNVPQANHSNYSH
jgi:hypothetical protein